MALLRHWGATETPPRSGSARPGLREVLVTAVAALLLVPVVDTAAGETRLPTVVIEQTVTVSDPLDAWLGGASGTEGDLELARETSLPGVTVLPGSRGQLLYRVSLADDEAARAALAGSLSAYETARLELWSDLNRRLEFIPGLVGYIDLRIAEARSLLEEATPDPATGTAAGGPRAVEADIETWTAIREELTRLRRTVMEPIWAGVPVRRRLEEIDRALDDRFWATMSAGRA